MEAQKPESESKFLKMPQIEPLFSREWFIFNLAAPLTLYICWAVPYYFIVLLFGGRCLKQYGYDNLYDWFIMGEFWTPYVNYFGPCLSPILFLFIHLGLFMFSMIPALASLYSQKAQVALMFFWMFVAICRGNDYYAQIFLFAKKLRTQTTILNLVMADDMVQLSKKKV